MGSLPTTKGGNVLLKDVSLPGSVEPGESLVAEVTVKNRAAWINPFDGDRCNNPFAGYKMRIGYLTPSGETKYTNEKCVAGDGSSQTWSVEGLTAPEEEGSHDFEAWVEMTGSGKTTDSITQSFSVTSTPVETPDDDGANNSDDGLRPLGDADGDGHRNFADPEPHNPEVPSGGGPLNIGGQIDKLLLVLGVLAIAWAADSGAEVLS